jgi:uncharacterized protein YndB with AHSA1/START domain
MVLRTRLMRSMCDRAEFGGLIMHGPDGTDYKNEIVYVEVVKPERLVYDHVSGPKFHVTVTFSEDGKKTRLSMQMLFESAAERENTVKKFSTVEGLNQTLGRLEEHLAKMAGERS